MFADEFKQVKQTFKVLNWPSVRWPIDCHKSSHWISYYGIHRLNLFDQQFVGNRPYYGHHKHLEWRLLSNSNWVKILDTLTCCKLLQLVITSCSSNQMTSRGWKCFPFELSELLIQKFEKILFTRFSWWKVFHENFFRKLVSWIELLFSGWRIHSVKLTLWIKPNWSQCKWLVGIGVTQSTLQSFSVYSPT